MHGHFLPIKYRGLQLRVDLAFVTWMRHPVDRLISHYHYWLREYDPQRSPEVQRRLHDEGWSLERFCREKRMRNVYSRFLWGMKLERFDFIGIVEDAARSYELFYRMWPMERIEMPLENVNQARRGRSYDVPSRTRVLIESMNRKDLELYERARSLNRELCGTYEV